jgi:hypothetical protein
MLPALRDENILRIKSRLVDLVAPDLQKIPSGQLSRQVMRQYNATWQENQVALYLT